MQMRILLAAYNVLNGAQGAGQYPDPDPDPDLVMDLNSDDPAS